MAHDLGGKVSAATLKEFGKTRLEVLDPTVLFEGLNPDLVCWMSHGDTVEAPPPGFTVSAATENCPVAAMYDADAPLLRRPVPPGSRPHALGHRGHPGLPGEGLRDAGPVDDGVVHRAAGARSSASRSATSQVVCGLSGGIDSCTVAALVHKAIGDQLTCIFVNHGLLRKGEAEDVQRQFAAAFNINLIYVDAEERFLTPPGRRHRPGAQAQDHRRGVRARLRGRVLQADRRRRFWPRARSTRT